MNFVDYGKLTTNLVGMLCNSCCFLRSKLLTSHDFYDLKLLSHLLNEPHKNKNNVSNNYNKTLLNANERPISNKVYKLTHKLG